MPGNGAYFCFFERHETMLPRYRYNQSSLSGTRLDLIIRGDSIERFPEITCCTGNSVDRYRHLSNSARSGLGAKSPRARKERMAGRKLAAGRKCGVRTVCGRKVELFVITFLSTPSVPAT